MDFLSGLLGSLAGYLHLDSPVASGVLVLLLAVSEFLGSFAVFKSSSVFVLVVSLLKSLKGKVLPPPV